jgi:hypothetical protein
VPYGTVEEVEAFLNSSGFDGQLNKKELAP